jgi:hypothetical protein
MPLMGKAIFDQERWFAERYSAGTEWVRTWTFRFGIDAMVQRHHSTLSFEIKTMILFAPRQNLPEDWIIEVDGGNEQKLVKPIPIGAFPMDMLCLCRWYNNRRARVTIMLANPRPDLDVPLGMQSCRPIGTFLLPPSQNGPLPPDWNRQCWTGSRGEGHYFRQT